MTTMMLMCERQLRAEGREDEMTKGYEDYVVITESALEGQVVAITSKPRDEWPKMFNI